MRIPDPVLNEDFYMVKRIGGNVTLPIPRTRFEELLYIYAGCTIERPTPKTVEERFLDYITGGESELPAPKTRLQSYMYNVANPLNKIPIVPPKTRFECYWFVMSEGNNVISDELPVEFTSVGGFLLVYTIWGNSEQDGTPSPENPVEVQSVGDLVIDEIDPNYGKYKIPVTVSGENGREITTVIYLDEPLRKIGDYADYIDFENRCVVRKISTLDLGSIEWVKTASSNFQSRFLITNMRVVDNKDVNNALCSAYPEVAANKLTSFDAGFSSCINKEPRLYFRDTDKMALTAEEFQASMAGIELYYTLAESTVESLHIPQIPTFAGTNVLDVDTTVKPSKIELVTRTE